MIINEINDVKISNLEIEYKIKDMQTLINNLKSDSDKLQYVIDNQLFNMEVQQEYTKNIKDNTLVYDKQLDEIVMCKQKIDSITDEIEELKCNYKNMMVKIRPNMTDA